MLIRGSFVWCPSLGQLKIVQDHLLVVDGSGFISYFDSADSTNSIAYLEDSADEPIVIPTGSFILPTFCDLHLHAPQFLYQGNGLHLPLMQWLNEYAFKAEERIDADHTLARQVYSRLAKRLVQNGTGSVLLFGTIKEETNLILADVMQKAGVRAFVGKLSMDRSSRLSYVEDSAESSLASAKSFVERCRASILHLPTHRRTIEPVITPRFVPTCSDPLLRGLGELSRSLSVRIQSHLAESLDQVEWVRKERGIEDLEVFQRSGLITPRTVQAHCTFLDLPSLRSLHDNGTAIAHCPLSNAYFSAEPFHLHEALQEGVKVGLGTDVAGGYSLDMMNAMRQAVAVSRMRQGSHVMGGGEGNLTIDWKEALYLATVGGAKSLGLATGTFDIGSPFDAQQIRLFDPEMGSGSGALDFFDLEVDGGKRRLCEDMIEKWWCLGEPLNRSSVWVQGVSVYVNKM